MTLSSHHRRFRAGQRGIVLVTILALLAILTILVVGFVLSMRMERMASSSMADNEKAKLLARSALAQVTSLLANNIPDPVAPDSPAPTPAYNWFINPGRLTLISGAGTKTIIPLYSGDAASTDAVSGFNLNAPEASTGKYPITGANNPMWVSWVNILQDPATPASSSNKVVGRYAFWVDDESAKINFNTARGKPANASSMITLPAGWTTTNPRDLQGLQEPTFPIVASTGTVNYSLSSPGAVNLDMLGLTSTNISSLESDVDQTGFFQSPEAIKNYVSSPDTFYESNKFNLTPFSRSPEFNVFGKSRLYMESWYAKSASASLENGPTYQYLCCTDEPLLFWGRGSLLGTQTGNPGDAMRQMREPVFKALANDLNRSDWPGFVGRKFRWTNDPLGQQETDQIALNILTMGLWGNLPFGNGSAVPSGLTDAHARWGQITGMYPSATSNLDTDVWKGELSGQPMLPFSPTPVISEIRTTLVPVSTAGGTPPLGPPPYYYKFTVSCECYYPPGGFWISDPVAGKAFVNANSSDANGILCMFIASMHAKCTVSTTSTYTELPDSKKVMPIATTPLDGFSIASSIPWYPASGGTFTLSTGTNSGAAVWSNLPTTVQFDVRVGLKCQNGGTLQLAPVVAPSYDTGAVGLQPSSGNDSDATLSFKFSIPANPDTVNGYEQSYEIPDPNMAGTKSYWALSTSPTGDTMGTTNSNWTAYTSSAASKNGMWDFGSSAREGSTGMFGFVPTGMQRGKPWETLQFHKYTVGSNDLPDWLVLDLLAPNWNAPDSYRNSSAGKINLNSHIYPDDSPNFTPPVRTAPLQAVFQYLPNGSDIVSQINNYQASGGYFDYLGRMCEVPEIADDSLATQSTDFEREELVRFVSGMLTTQSNTFGVWGVSQVVQKNPTATSNYGSYQQGDTIRSQKRFYAVVERYVWPGVDGVLGNGAVDSTTGTYTANSQPSKLPAQSPVQAISSASQWMGFDGPVAPTSTLSTLFNYTNYAKTSLANANNPITPVIKYRIIYFHYLD